MLYTVRHMLGNLEVHNALVSLIVGRTSVMIFAIVIGIIVIYFLATTKRDNLPKVRRLAGLDAIKEAVGRAVETGRPVHFTPGWTERQLYTGGSGGSGGAADILAGMSVLSYLARTVADYGSRLIVTLGSAELVPMAGEIVRNGYMAAGKADAFKPEDIIFFSSDQFAYAAGVMGLVKREQIAANVMVGPFLAESLLFAEAAYQVGSIQVAGTPSVFQTPFFVAVCDYVLIGEECYAAGALLSEDPHQLGSIRGTDISKVLVVAILLVGVLLSVLGSKVVVQLLKT